MNAQNDIKSQIIFGGGAKLPLTIAVVVTAFPFEASTKLLLDWMLTLTSLKVTLLLIPQELRSSTTDAEAEAAVIAVGHAEEL